MTLEELKAQLASEGVTDQLQINQRISQAIASGELTGASAGGPTAAEKSERFLGEYGAQSEEDIAGAARLIAPGLEETQPAEPQGVVSTFRTPAEQAAGVAPVQMGQEAPPGEAQVETVQPSLYAPEGTPGAPGGARLPRTRIPGTMDLEQAIGAVPGAFKEAAAGTEEAAGKYKAALGEMKEAGQELARTEADVMEERRIVSEQLHAEHYEREQERQEHVDGEMTKLQGAVSDLRTSGIDPYRFYRHSDGSVDYPKSIASAIAVGMGALGSNLPRQYGGTGGPNLAMQIIERAIDRDLGAQKEDLANKRAGVGLQMNLLGQMRSQFGEERQADRAARVVMLDHYKLKLEEARAKAGDANTAAKFDAAIADVDVRTAQISGDFKIKSAQQAVVGAEKKLTADSRRVALKMRQQAAQIKAMAPAKGKQLPASAVAKMADFRAAGGILSSVQNTWNTKMKGKFAGGLAANAPWATDAKLYEDEIKTAAQFIGKKLEGRMTDEDYLRILGMFPSPGDSDTRAQAKFRALYKYLGAMEGATVRTFGETGFDVSGFKQRKPIEGEGKAQ